MTDQEFQAGVTAAVEAYYASLNGSYPVVTFSYNYVPAAPASETVTVTFPAPTVS